MLHTAWYLDELAHGVPAHLGAGHPTAMGAMPSPGPTRASGR
ncbi:MAG: hypothetical protein ACLPUG_14600 [Acidimicrobiales bacterium]